MVSVFPATISFKEAKDGGFLKRITIADNSDSQDSNNGNDDDVSRPNPAPYWAPTPPPPPKQNCSTPESIVETCRAFLLSHQMVGFKFGKPFHFYRPSLQKYGPHQWLWDGGSHQIAWSHLNVTNSILALRTFLSMQKPNGMLSQSIFWGPTSILDDATLIAMWGNRETMQISQMPVTPFALRAIWNTTKDVSYLKEFVPSLIRYFEWWENTRVLEPNGLLSIIHGWESGLDASPIYDPAYGVTVPRPPALDLYPKFDELVLEYSFRYQWNMTAILGRTLPPPTWLQSWFMVEDIGVNAVYAAGWGTLADLAANYDKNVSAYCAQKAQKWTKRVISNGWNSTLQRFVSFYRDNRNNRVEVATETVQSLFPLLLNLPQTMVDSIVNNQILNPKKFWLKYPIPSVSADAPQFDAEFYGDLMWRGPTWPILNWIVMEGLDRHGRRDVGDQLLSRWIALYQQTGVWEHYNPLTGAPYGVEGLGMSTLIVDWLYRYGVVNATNPFRS